MNNYDEALTSITRMVSEKRIAPATANMLFRSVMRDSYAHLKQAKHPKTKASRESKKKWKLFLRFGRAIA